MVMNRQFSLPRYFNKIVINGKKNVKNIVHSLQIRQKGYM
jgi:hypothetical protein